MPFCSLFELINKLNQTHAPPVTQKPRFFQKSVQLGFQFSPLSPLSLLAFCGVREKKKTEREYLFFNFSETPVCVCFSVKSSMAHLYNYPSSSCPQEPDDISVFLHQILLRSSSSSSSSFTRHHSVAALPDHLLTENQDHPAIPVPGPGQIHAPDPCSGVLKSSSGCSFTTRAVANVSSSSVGNLDNEPDEYDYESEVQFC